MTQGRKSKTVLALSCALGALLAGAPPGARGALAQADQEYNLQIPGAEPAAATGGSGASASAGLQLERRPRRRPTTAAVAATARDRRRHGCKSTESTGAGANGGRFQRPRSRLAAWRASAAPVRRRRRLVR